MAGKITDINPKIITNLLLIGKLLRIISSAFCGIARFAIFVSSLPQNKGVSQITPMCFFVGVFFTTDILSQKEQSLEGFWNCRIDYECSWGWKDSYNSVLLSKDFGNSYRGSVFGGFIEISASFGEEYYFEIKGQNECYRKGKMKKHYFAGREYLSGSWISEGGNNAMWGTGLCCNGKIELYRDNKAKEEKEKPEIVNKNNKTNSVTEEKLQPGKKFILKNVLFKLSSDELLPEAYLELELLVGLLNENPEKIIRLEGHTDIDGPHRVNKQLSKKRVKQVKSYLVTKGIDKKRIQLKWYGEKKPLIRYGTVDERKINRRVEVKIIK